MSEREEGNGVSNEYRDDDIGGLGKMEIEGGEIMVLPLAFVVIAEAASSS